MRDFIDTVQVNPLRKDTSSVSRGALRPGRVMPLSDSLVRKDTLAVSDSLSVADSLSSADSLVARDTMPRPKGMIDRPAFSVAKDSTVEDFSGGKNMIYYYGDVKVTYGDLELTAEYMEYDVNRKVVYAAGVADTSGNVKGKPKMTQAGKTYSMDNVFYNFETGKARIKNMITDEEDGQLRGDNLNMMPNKSINISGGKYTVCELDHPHYYLKMSKAVVETEPKQKTVFGPAWLVLEDVPLPLVLPFGFVPKRPDRASGILFPTFGEEEARGLFMKDGGFYFVLGDYLDVALTGSIFTKGSWNVKMASRYKWRYK
ncbi:MAG: LPS-assembly protein LptD, partial [Bacteroidales bacterium]|nr:LPS-assembly protein LptD [Bacteroidales bacterium]